jgi:hypothetical protein
MPTKKELKYCHGALVVKAAKMLNF